MNCHFGRAEALRCLMMQASENLVWGDFCQGCLRGPYPFFLSLSFFVRPAQHVSSSRPTMGWGRRAQEPSRMARERATAKGLVLDGSEHDGTVAVVGDDDIE